MYACMTPVGFDTSDKFENHWTMRLITLSQLCDDNLVRFFTAYNFLHALSYQSIITEQRFV